MRELLVVGGIPGAGKSTWLARADLPGHVVLDSEQVAARWRARAPRVPYRLLRPLVHVAHHARIARAVLRAPGPVAVHETATRRPARRWLLWLARRAGRPACLLVLTVDAETARDRQRRRGRVVSARSMHRHLRRAVRMRHEVAGEGWAEVAYSSPEPRASSSACSASSTTPSPNCLRYGSSVLPLTARL